ncbi:MAG: GatB/YqeY domain-containing protein [Desulfovibrionaceae bacterium]|nr:GatB/YqeY domain-containing protein [Desulfovibrionaceae bacterium]
MSLSLQIEKDYITAYKAKDTLRVSVLRMLKTSLKRRLVDTSRPDAQLDDEETMDIIIKEAKQRRDSIAEYNKAGRPDLAEKEQAELAILEDYLPKALTDEELAQAIEEMVAKVGASQPSDMGKVMGPLMKALKGRVDGGRLSSAVKARLAQ